MRTSFVPVALAFSALFGCGPTTSPVPPSLAPPAPRGPEAPPVPAGSSDVGGGAHAAPSPSKSGPEGAACGGIAGFGCAAGLYCSFAADAHCGAADQTGVCRPVPEMCTEEYAPVCGCNDRTYPNACHAAREGISVADSKPCATPQLSEGQTCGTRGVAGDCGPGLFCEFDGNCGADDRGGVCKKKPEMCTKIYAPVCGCDGATHGSACVAAAAGVSVAARGECKK
ncbi:MAG TPA: Kazal-type serine protease inhibitor domain-containing protein [Polyangiaceae bacterium]